MRKIILIAHNIRSTHNVGSLLRTAEGIGAQVYLTGYTPYPIRANDSRLPHIAQKLHKDIQKTALGAESQPLWEYRENISTTLEALKDDGYEIAALEQTEGAVELHKYKAPDKIAILLGSEVTGIDHDLLNRISQHLVIPMYGEKESFNVVQAAAMLLFYLRFFN